jgi:hypothetical protein
MNKKRRNKTYRNRLKSFESSIAHSEERSGFILYIPE